MHGVAFGEQRRGAQIERLARLDQPQRARRRLAQTQLGGDAAQHGGGHIVARNAVERAVLAAQITI